MEVTVRISGAQGEGVETAGRLFATAAARLGYHVFAYRQYGSIIKGNPTMFYQVRISSEKIYSHGRWRRYDLLVALNDRALKAHLDGASVAIYDGASSGKALGVPLSDIANRHGNRIMRNMAAVGAAAGLLGMDIGPLEELIRREFGERGEKLAEANIAVLREAYEYAGKAASPLAQLGRVGGPRPLLSGAEALAIGAVMAGMKFYVAYPMTPASPIFHWLAEWGPKFGVAVVQAEDELAAMNMVIGASYAGVRAATGTSGGGFDLMHEAFGLAAMVEAPAVVFLSQRGGPSTGLPTETEQSDLYSAMAPSHGEYPHAIIAPRTIEEAPYAVAKAFNLAEKFQMPVIVLTDLYFNESLATVDGIDPSRFKIERGELLKAPVVWEQYRRYKITESGISPRTVPGVPGGMHIATSDEHDERGDVITDVHMPELRRAMHAKRMRKMERVVEEMEEPALRKADVVAVAWGSTAMPLLDHLARRDLGYALFRDIYPLPAGGWREALNGAKEVVVVEVNYRGQFADYLASRGVKVTRRVLKWWGEPFSMEDLEEAL